MTVPLAPEQPQPLVAPTPPWTPFNRLPTDTEPLIAAMRRRRLGRLIDSAKFESFPPEWQQVAIMEYEAMRQIEASAAQIQAAAQQPQRAQPQNPTQEPGAVP